MSWSWNLRQASDAVEVDEDEEVDGEEESVGSFRKTRSWRRFLTDALLSARAKKKDLSSEPTRAKKVHTWRRLSRRRVASAIEGQCRCKRSDIVWYCLHNFPLAARHYFREASFFGRHCGLLLRKGIWAYADLTRGLGGAYADFQGQPPTPRFHQPKRQPDHSCELYTWQTFRVICSDPNLPFEQYWIERGCHAELSSIMGCKPMFQKR